MSIQYSKDHEWIDTSEPAAAVVGNVVGTDVPMAPNLPTYSDNLKGSLAIDTNFWADHDSELKERFSAWLAAS